MERSRQDRLDDRSVDVGQTVVAALELVSQAGVVDAQAVENGGVQVVNVHRVLDNVVTEFVGVAVSDARLDPAAGEPDRETPRMVVAAVIFGGQRALAIDRAAEFSAPDDQGVVKQPALLQVGDQCRRRAGRCRGTVRRSASEDGRAGPSRDERAG